MTLKHLPDQVSDAASQVKGKLDDLARTVSEKAEETRCAAASGLDRTALAVYEGGDKVADLAHATASKINVTARYVRRNNFKRMLTDAGKTMKRHPTASLVVAGIVVFSLGRVLRPSD